MFEMLLIFIIISLILFMMIIECLFFQDSPSAKQREGEHIGNWKPSIALISVNLIFLILCAWGVHRVDWVYTNKYFSGNGTMLTDIGFTEEYYGLSYIFYGFFLIHCILFVYAGWCAIKESKQAKGEMEFKSKSKLWR